MTDNRPEPTTDRWQPLRIGLADLFYYDDEVFHFHDGRLLLRGNNGTGKSKVMALTLPFLLDGQLFPSRVEPDGDSNKRMEWNLLLGKGGERQGYTWLEFGRIGANGPEYCTLGCGLKAISGRDVRSWFFVTPQRVGEDLALVEDGRTPSPDRLKQILADSASFHDQAQDYRRTVDERLFGLGAERYEALLDLLLQLRQPQLSKKPDEERLSGALTEALPPLDPEVLADVADAYRNLEADRLETESLEEAQQAVTQFLGHYSQYAAIAARRRAKPVCTTHKAYEETLSTYHHNETALSEAYAEDERLWTREDEIDAAINEADEQRATLRESPAMRSAENLSDSKEKAQNRRKEAEQAEASRASKQREQEDREQQKTEQDKAGREAEENLHNLLERLHGHASNAGVADDHASSITDHGLPEAMADPDGVTGVLSRIHKARLERVDLLDEQNDALTRAEHQAERARENWQSASEELERLQQNQEDARSAREDAGDELVRSWRTYTAGLTELALPDAEADLARLTDWIPHIEGENPIAAALAEVHESHVHAMGEQRAALNQEHDRIQEELDALDAEHSRLSTGETIQPPPPHTRADGARDERPGAPLWQLLEFRNTVTDDERAGLEAALESSGLLDAWVLPDGDVLGDNEHDTVLTLDAPTADQALACALIPATAWPDDTPPVETAVIEGVLERIGNGPDSGCHTWVATDGRWRQGPARGAWHKESAAFIGHAAREAARQARLEAIAAERARHENALADAKASLQTLDERTRKVRSEWQEIPDDTGLRNAHADEAAVLRQVNAQSERTEKARAALDESLEQARAARQSRDELADDLQLPVEPEGLNRVREALGEYDAGTRELRGTLSSRNREAQLMEQRRKELASTERELEEARGKAKTTEDAAARAETRHNTLQESVGEEVASLNARIEDIDDRLERLHAERKATQDSKGENKSRIGGLERDIAHGRESLESIGAERDEAIKRLRELSEKGLLDVATAGELVVSEAQSWEAEPAVQFARQLQDALATMDDDDRAWQRQQKGLYEHFNELQHSLGRHGHGATVEQQDDLLVVYIVFQNRRRAPEALAEDLAAEVQQRQELLTARERELVENYLIDEVASHLQQRLVDTERQVNEMNEELATRPTSTGMRLRIRWHPLGEGETLAGLTAPAGLAATSKRLLRQSMDAWTLEDREAVGAFIQERIDEARQSDDGGDMRQVLERALDYRYWHRFTIERWQNGQWRPAYGPASGGERALIITLPLFAAAASHYGSARPESPRLIMLDEVFAGIDPDARSKAMGLLASFDLDVMMTSENEWGCYPEVPGLSIGQLVRRDGVDAIYVSRWRWDGVSKKRDSAPDRPSELPAEDPGEAAAEPSSETLF